MNRGFTLIELLFVIAVLGLISTSGILFYQQQLQNQKVEQTIAQIMQWQQAGMAYYVKNKKWGDAATLMKDGYMLQNADRTSPWCATGTCSPAAYTISSTPNLFTVTAIMPKVSLATQQAIAARLPYGIATGTGITSTVNIPLAGLETGLDVIVMDVVPYTLEGSKGDFYFQGVGELATNSFITPPNVGVVLKRNGSPVLASACGSIYGEAYSFVPYATVTSYQVGNFPSNKPSDAQPAVFSMALVGASSNDRGEVIIKARFVPQVYILKLDVRTMYSEPREALKNELKVQGQVFYICCKKGIACVPQATWGLLP